MLVRITALVLKAVRAFKKSRLIKLIQDGKTDKKELKHLTQPPTKFTIFTADANTEQLMPSTVSKLSHMNIKLREQDLSEALDYLYRKATREVIEFNDKKRVEKEGIEREGVLYAKSRILDGQTIRALGGLEEVVNLETITGIKFSVPLVDKHSPLAVSIATHLHYNVVKHKGTETTYRMSLQYVKILGRKALLKAIEDDCVKCKRLKKKYLQQMMGPLADTQLTISPVFYFTLVDMWGPVRTYCPGYERVGTTRNTKTKAYDVHMLVFGCVATGTVNVQVIEKKNTEAVLDGFTRFFAEAIVPKVCYPDEDGALKEALRDGEICLQDLEGTLNIEKGIEFETCLPQGHNTHGRIERRIRMLKESLEKSNMKGTRCHATGLQTIAKVIEREVNSIPLGFLEQDTREGKALRILTPGMLKLNAMNNRSPRGLFTIPDKASDIMKNVEKIYNLWFQVWNTDYVPLIANRSKWHEEGDTLAEHDIILFKLTDSPMAPDWKLGKVEEVNAGRDGLVRGATIAYKNVQEGQDDRKLMVVKRPIRQIVKLFNVDDTSLIGDLIQTKQLVKKILDSKMTSKAEDLTKTMVSGPDAFPILDIKEDANHTRNKVGLIEMKTNMFAAINLPCNSSMYTRAVHET